MKKFYLLATIAVLGFGNAGRAQYTATNTGNWSNPITWAPGAKPSASCTDCTIKINANVIVTLDADVTLAGTTVLTIGSDATSPAKLIIPFSNNVNFFAAHNRINLFNNGMALPGAPPGIKLLNSNTSIDATAAGQFDGVFNNFLNVVFVKSVGNSPSVFLGGVGISTLPPALGTSVTGPTSIGATGSPLPVVLSRFDAVLADKVVNLYWTTDVEMNSDHFSVERSADASHWKSLGIVAAKGFSDVKANYSFTDESPSGGVNYYRLQMVDRDGKYKYSQVKVVNGNLAADVRVFPNPANNFVNVTLGIDMNAGVTIRFVNQFGQVLQQRKLNHAAGTTISLPVNNYPQGNYILQITGDDGSRQTRKVLINR